MNKAKIHYWHSPLSVTEKNHLKNDAGISLRSKQTFIESLAWQKEQGIRCYECEAIGRKLKEIEK